MEQFDFIIIGGGFFGVYSALFLAEKGHRIALVEQDSQLMTRAAVINQARLHTGYHYPRSIGTARLSDEYRQRFRKEHQAFINNKFLHLYGLDSYQSFTDTAQFERFCEALQIPCEKIETHPLINSQRLKALYKVEELSFDPDAIAAYYVRRIEKESRIKLFVKNTVRKVKVSDFGWEMTLSKGERLAAGSAINASYAGTNQIQSLFKQPLLDLVYELSEVCLCQPGAFDKTGLTVMDGPFCSYLPFGNSGFHSLTSVLYTHHALSKEELPRFSCQSKNERCRPGNLQPCSTCKVRPTSSFEKMKKQLTLYLPESCMPIYRYSRFTVKTKLAASQIDDSRPTEIGQFQKNPAFYCIFAGKINAVYEIEKVLNI